MLRFIYLTYYILLAYWTLEIGIKIGAFYTQFFKKTKNILVIAYYIATWVSLALWLKDTESYPYFPVLISFRLLWMFKMFLFVDSFRKIFRIFIMALPSLSAIVLIIYIVAYIYSLIGMELYGYILEEGVGINRNANFTNFGLSIMTLFRVSVGENWPDILLDLQRDLQPNYICNVFQNTFENYLVYG
jgi:hypothetical protein